MIREPSEDDRKKVASARLELDAAMKIVDALEPVDGETRERVLAAAAILTGVASIGIVRTVLRRLRAAHEGPQ